MVTSLRHVPLILGVLVTLFFIGGMALMGWRDHQAEARCHALGGQTWDSGTHCTLGGRTVSTR